MGRPIVGIGDGGYPNGSLE